MNKENTKIIAWIGNTFFRTGMDQLGYKTIHIPIRGQQVFTWKDIVEKSGCIPDMVVYADRSIAPPLAGVESFPCLTIFYCIDTHIHSWYPLYAQGFDICLVSLKDHLNRFTPRLPDSRLLWFPPVVMNNDVPLTMEKEWDLLFVGKVDPDLTPERMKFLDEVAKLVPGLHITQGEYRKLFPKARVVLNIAERGDLNFRVFEALACGSCLLTPYIEHGLNDIFTDGVHLTTYEAGNAADLVNKLEQLLANKELREKIARQGNELIESSHRIIHRAETLQAVISGMDVNKAVSTRLAANPIIRKNFMKSIYLHWAEAISDPLLKQVYLQAAKN
ncbi:Glycosyl transferases group 1 [Maridesulfovibrio ferrireducens]|uniref:Glycosyl transferases group 1 n=1 Tax=Maridesulfovibrio ferrireducens TaxID=246191 RepID=A0A1G9G288_9BACT|nr:glycosyltransferase [Maridesulfovibrio ferrireducens]SDK94751.1 Glycosyl transferases group 1 [Maridesulfovibrio ferrireducens]